MASRSSERRTITVFSADITTDGTAVTDTDLTGRRIRNLHPPWVMNTTVTDAGATASGGTNYSAQAILQDCATLTGTYVTAFSGTAITTPTTGTDRKTDATQLRDFVRCVVTLSAGTQNAGSTVVVTLTGNGTA